MKINKEELHVIFEGIKNNDELKFNELYTKYYNLIYSISLSILKNKENSEDVAQAIFTKIYSLPKKQLPTQGEASWLYTVTKNESINYLKKLRNDTNIDNIYYIAEEGGIDDIISKDSYNRIMSKLDEKEKEIVSLKIIAGLSFRQIAKLRNMPIGTVQWKYYKSLNTIKLLITNLCISIIAIGAFVLRKVRKKKENTLESENATSNETVTNSEIIADSESIADNKVTENHENTVNSENILSNENTLNSGNNIFNNEQTVITETVESTQKSSEITFIDVGLLTIFIIFFTLTILAVITIIKNSKRTGKKLK